MKSKDKRHKSVAAKRIRRQKAALLAVFVFALVMVCLFTPLFGITDIEVKNNRILDSESVIKASGIQIGENVFKIDTAKAEKGICSLGHVDTAQVKRKFPSRIVIDVTECSETAYVLFAGNYVGIDDSLKVISVSKASQIKADKPVVSGMALKSFKIGSVLTASKPEKAEMLKKILVCLEKTELISSAVKINISDSDNVYFTMDTDTKVIIGDSGQTEYKFTYLTEVLKNLDDLRGGEIDLSDTENVIYKGGN